jgi:glycosyltransferase involved in cell wall biosynthesis
MTRCKLVIDGYNLQLTHGTGVATYARNLTYCARDIGCDVHVLYGSGRVFPKEPLLSEINFFDAKEGSGSAMIRLLRQASHVFPYPWDLPARQVPVSGAVITRAFKSRLPFFDGLWTSDRLFERAHVRFYAYRKFSEVSLPFRPDIVHWTYPLPLRIPHAKNIYTIHDLVPLRLPHTTLDLKPNYLRLVRSIARNADHIVTVSETSRRDIIDLLGVPEDRVTNTYQAVDIPSKYQNKPDSVVKREVEGAFALPFKGYFLFFGAIEPKKNVGRLVEAYLSSGIATPLAIVGKLAWKTDEELRLVEQDVVKRQRRIRRFDYAPFPLLVSLIRGAKAVLFPSLYEGFGLPALEAMQLGVPVLASTEGALPEVIGDAGLLVDPYDPREIAEGIRRLDAEGELRGALVEKGRKRAEFFSPEAYRARLTRLYDIVRTGQPTPP